ncbi:MAG: lipopolysaccharide heptosyltransferase II [Candidatus Omnitrophica bacterium]|nr:lipopolysaccharide heptosyltransferase II [Candidatus Omnitrophota bacterium]
MSEAYKKILVVRTDRVGDVVLTTPALSALRKAYPYAKIGLLVAPLTYDLVSKNKDLNKVLVDDREGQHKGLFGFLKLVKKIKKQNYDVAVIFHTKKRTNLLCFLAGIPRRIGYKNKKFGRLLTDPIEDTRHHGKKHEVEYCLDVLKPLGVTSSECRLNVSVHEDAEEWLNQFLAQNHISADDKIIAIHPGASDPAKQWPEHCFAELIDRLYESRDVKIVLLGSANIRHVSREVKSLTRHPAIELTGLTSMAQLISLLKHSSILVSNDSGPVHIAAAVGTPVVSIFTRNLPGINPERWRPLGDRHQVICVSEKAVQEYRKANPLSFEKAGKIDPKYLELIPVTEVFEAVDSLCKLC